MTSAKMSAFIEKLLEKTKEGQIKWSRFPSRKNNDLWASDTKSFTCMAGNMDIVLLSDEELENIVLQIRYDRNLPAVEIDMEEQPEEVRRVAIRLVNYVYNLFPNLEKSIDQFLEEP